jgi:hypothetical protein
LLNRGSDAVHPGLMDTNDDRALEHDPQKLEDFSDKIMRQNKDFDVAHDSTRIDFALAAKLFKLVNIIAHNQITEPKEIAELFGTISGNGQAASPGMQAVTLSPSD